jgi:hypothetical protein
MKTKSQSPICPDEPSEDPTTSENVIRIQTVLDTVTSIGCTDGEDLSAMSMDGNDGIQTYHNILRQQSKWMADYWFSFTLPCWTWTRDLRRYTGA